MGHTAHLRKHKRRRLKLYFRYFLIIFPWMRTDPNHPRVRCAKFGWNQHSGPGEADFKFRQYFFAFSQLSAIDKGHGPSFEQTWIPFT